MQLLLKSVFLIFRQIALYMTNFLLYRYFNFDEVVIRELLGKKLSKSTRRDLDEISAKCQIQLKSCQRQVRLLKSE